MLSMVQITHSGCLMYMRCDARGGAGPSVVHVCAVIGVAGSGGGRGALRTDPLRLDAPLYLAQLPLHALHQRLGKVTHM